MRAITPCGLAVIAFALMVLASPTRAQTLDKGGSQATQSSSAAKSEKNSAIGFKPKWNRASQQVDKKSTKVQK